MTVILVVYRNDCNISSLTLLTTFKSVEVCTTEASNGQGLVTVGKVLTLIPKSDDEQTLSQSVMLQERYQRIDGAEKSNSKSKYL